MKGRRPIRRGSLVILTKPADFNRPSEQSVLDSQTSGSTGQPTRVSFGFEFFEQWAIAGLVTQDLLTTANRPTAQWRDDGPSRMLRSARTGALPDKSFTTARFRWTAEGIRSLILSNFTLVAVRLAGYPIHKSRFVPRDQPLPVVRWLGEKASSGTPAAIACAPSLAIRVCAYAKEHGFDLTGTQFQLSGEPYTA